MLRLYLAGPAGSGKSTVAGLLVERHGFARLSLGDFPRALAAERGLAPTRAALQALGDELRGNEAGRLARLALDRLTEVRRAVVDGVRLAEEAALLREAGFVGVGVGAAPRIRRQRLHRRGECWGAGEVGHRTEFGVHFVPVDHRIDAGGDLLPLVSEVALLVAALETVLALGLPMAGGQRPGDVG